MWHTCPQRSPAYAGGAPKIGCHSLNALGAFSSHGYRPSLLGQHSPSVEPFAPHRFAILLHLRTSRDFVSRRSAYTPYPYASSTRRVRGVTLTRLPDFGRSRPSIRCAIHGARGVAQYGLPLFSVGRAIRISYARSTRRVRGVTLTRLPDFGRSRPSIRCAIHGARGVSQYGLPLFFVGRAIRISYARSTRRVRGVTLTRLPDFGRSRPSIRCAIHGARGVSQYGLPLFFVGRAVRISYARSTRRVRGVTLTRLPDFGRSRPSIRCAIHGARGVSQYGLPLFFVGRAIRISYARSTRRVRGVTPTRLPDFGRSRPSIRCAIHGARGVAQYGLPLFSVGRAVRISYARSTRRVRGVTLTRLPDFGRSRPSIRCAIHGARGVSQYGLPLFSVGRAVRISYARSTRRVRGVTLTRLPDFGRSRP